MNSQAATLLTNDHLLEAMPDACIIAGPDGTIAMVNSHGSRNIYRRFLMAIIAASCVASGIQALSAAALKQNQKTSNSSSSSASGSSSAQISPEAQFLSQLQQMQSQNPTQFSQLMTNAASQLTTAAQSATGQQATILTNLASKFTSAASGDLSGFQPASAGSTGSSAAQAAQAAYQQYSQGSSAQQSGTSSGGHHHHHHHGGGSSASSTTSASSSSDPSGSSLGQIISQVMATVKAGLSSS